MVKIAFDRGFYMKSVFLRVKIAFDRGFYMKSVFLDPKNDKKDENPINPKGQKWVVFPARIGFKNVIKLCFFGVLPTQIGLEFEYVVFPARIGFKK